MRWRKSTLLLLLPLAATGCNHQQDVPSAPKLPVHTSESTSKQDVSTTESSSVTTTEVSTSTSVETSAPTTLGSRGTTTTALPEVSYEPEPIIRSAEFWRQLRLCESGDGQSSANLYQFVFSTWQSAGGIGQPEDHSESYQTSIAQRWAAILQIRGSHPGSTGGWPTCWWVALANS